MPMWSLFLHVQEADEAKCIGDFELSDTYLNIPKIIAVAKETGCDAIHPGYGFLAENPLFVEACDQAGIIFIGPRLMSCASWVINYSAWIRLKKRVPVTEGLTGNTATLLQAGSKIGFPVLIKAAAGGGGKGMQIVRNEKDLPVALESTSRQALAIWRRFHLSWKYLEEPVTLNSRYWAITTVT